ncbi:MOSC domain-containing protein [Leucobacter viscericola]|uniref:MOSC domain-containing protein n=1 Tax=Leucobacter viscericola TaxID=2714935 RepID=A0A6G7XHT0_9MICO|nr:MOSC domain-containing protein [Leucobacter viscericola]QIK64036.1 MOSC domain-containing protein [Leucobacter viscericola]
MARVVALTRYPVKGFTAEPLESLTVQPDGRVEGDRVLAFRFARAAEPEDREGLEYWPKSKGLALQDFPALAALRLSYDYAARRVRIMHGDAELIEAGLDEVGRAQMSEAVTEYVRSTPEGARLRGPGRLPLVLVGDGITSRFQDRPRGFVSVHGQASVDALEAELGSVVDSRRFRSNLVIEGLPAWQELEWSGEVRIGEVTFSTEGPIVRCLATHANPDTGVRDAPVLTTLTRGIGQKQPTLGRLLLPSGRGGIIRIGDEVRVA